MMKKKLSLFFLLTFLFVFNLSLQADSVVLIWNQETLKLIEKNDFNPATAARALNMVHTSIFDAWAAYDDKAIGTRRGSTLRRPCSEHTLANKAEAISFAAFRTLFSLFEQDALELIQLMFALGYDPANISTDPTTPAGIGNIAAIDEINFRLFDGANQTGTEPGSDGTPYSDYTGYTTPNTPFAIVDPNQFQILFQNGMLQVPVTPQWGLVVPFALTSPDEFAPHRPPATYPSRRYKQQAEEILHISAHLNDFKKVVAKYWADVDGTVTIDGQWNVFAQFVSRRDQQTLDEDVKLFFILNNAMLDCSIAAWYLKYFYNSERPETAIHFLFNGQEVKAWGGPFQGTQIILGQNWRPYLETPAFPEYVSGHSTFSAAGAEVLTLFTGSKRFGDSVLIPKGSSTIEPGLVPAKNIVLRWKTFQEAANEAGISRLYGGVHFRQGDVDGLKVGKKVGANAFAKSQYFIEGGILPDGISCGCSSSK